MSGPPREQGSGNACRLCGALLRETFLDLGASPLANAFLTAADLGSPEPFYPLHVRVCGECLLVQLPAVESPQTIFGDYLYFSSVSESWLAHARSFAHQMITALELGPSSHVLEVGSNDGYLLRYFKEAGVPVLGIDPAATVAQAASARGIRTLVRFFGAGVGRELAASSLQADLLVGNNVLAHVPDLHDFVEGLALALKPRGIVSLEFPHLLRLIQENQFDTIYHEHFCYFSLLAVERVLGEHGLSVFDVEQLPTHGGSLRVLARPGAAGSSRPTERAEAVRKLESDCGLHRLETYRGFEARARVVKENLLEFLQTARGQGRRVMGYGAPAKGNTLLNYCGVGTTLLPDTVDQSPHKQGLFLPGTHIPIRAPEAIREVKPDYLLILPWNLKEEITNQMAFIRDWGGRFVVPVPRLEVLP